MEFGFPSCNRVQRNFQGFSFFFTGGRRYSRRRGLVPNPRSIGLNWKDVLFVVHTARFFLSLGFFSEKGFFFSFFFSFFILIDDSLNEGIVIEGWKSGAREKCVLQRCIVRSRRVVNFSKLCYVSEFIYDILYGLSKLSRG